MFLCVKAKVKAKKPKILALRPKLKPGTNINDAPWFIQSGSLYLTVTLTNVNLFV